MLKLHSLDITGFKSFVDPVDVRFAGGITAIVGPNGCGKSNLTDAISWVLGEQSAKSLRGAKMEDVIFNGSDKRKPVGLADVSLTLLADPGSEHSVDGKIQIARRVFRAGGSQYRINGKVVRLKEIKELLMDTGLGIRAYSVIEQGKIGMILSGKPQERRKLLEEAAGITRYKERKRIAEVKLEEASSNLLRLDDIISEVARSLRSLKRQAGAARRYQEKQKLYRAILRQVLLGRWALLSEHLDTLDRDLHSLTDRDAELSSTLHRDEAAVAAGREQLDLLARELAARHQQHSDLAATIEGRQEFLKGARQRATEVEERLASGRTQAEERRQQTSDFRHSLGNLDERTRELIAERDEAARLVAEDDAKIASAQRSVEQTSSRLESIRQELLGAVAMVNQTRTSLQKEQVEIEKRTYRQRFLEEERTRLDRQQQEAGAILEAIDAKVAAARQELDEKTAEHQTKAQTLDTLLRREAELGEERRNLENHISSQQQRRRILEQLRQEHEEKQKSLVEKLSQIGISEPRFLAQKASPAKGWEDGIDHFLGELADAVVLEPGDDALELARALSQLDTSGIFLRPLPGASLPGGDVEDPAIHDSLAEALGLPPELAAALPPAFLVEAPEDGLRLAAEYPGMAFICRDRFFFLGGLLQVQGKEAAPGVLARSSELDSIRDDLNTSQERLQQCRTTLDHLVVERTHLAGEIHRMDERIAELRRDMAVAQARRQDSVSRKEKIDTQRQTVVDEQAEIARDLEAKTISKETLVTRLADAESRHAHLTETFDRVQAEVEAAKEERETLRTAGAGRRGRLDLLEERLESHNQESSRVRRQITYTEEQLQSWSQEGGVLERRLLELRDSMDTAERDLQQALSNRAGAQERVLEQQRALDQAREEMRQREETVQTLRANRDELRSQIETARVERAGQKQDAEHLAVTYIEEFQLALPGSLARPELARIATDAARKASLLDESETGDGNASDSEAGEDEQTAALGEPEEPGNVHDSDEEAEPEAAASPVENSPDASPDSPSPEATDPDEAMDGAGEEAVPATIEEDQVEIPRIDSATLVKLEGDLSRSKLALERIGPVNVLAADEYDEQKERLTFLKTQRQDVATSVESLKATIREINEASSERFRETFEEVNRTFGETFTRLFRGGEAEMRLFDEDDILETGIEIMARPPGKRPQNINLLSGGEKALTAIALLFALFQSRPSPFCILDEVDAPLDDVNVLRFVETLQEMAKDTQFLVVTHNKLTMEVASYLYGVTMEERGVSKLVSVQMEDIHPSEKEAVPA